MVGPPSPPPPPPARGGGGGGGGGGPPPPRPPGRGVGVRCAARGSALTPTLSPGRGVGVRCAGRGFALTPSLSPGRGGGSALREERVVPHSVPLSRERRKRQSDCPRNGVESRPLAIGAGFPVALLPTPPAFFDGVGAGAAVDILGQVKQFAESAAFRAPALRGV